nr:MAG: branched-chain amino acid ABC transporter permease [Sphaerobacter thermophilus]
MTQVLIDSAVRAAELSLIAVGLSLTWGIVRFANVAHVQYAPVAGYLTYFATISLGLGLVPAAILAITATGLLGLGLQRWFFQRLASSGAASALIGTLAVSIVITAVIQTVAGPRPRALPIPLAAGITIGDAVITRTQILIIGITAVTLPVFFAFLWFTRPGRAIRCVAVNPQLAEASGINTRRIRNLVTFIAAGLAGLGGILLGLDTSLDLNMGAMLLLPVIAATITGGIGNPAGAVLAATLIALAENAALGINFGALLGGDAFVPVNYRPAVGFLVLILVLLLRPEGIFGRSGRRA